MPDKFNRIGVMSVVHEGRKPFGMQTYFFEDMIRSTDVDAHEIFFFSPLDWNIDVEEVCGYNFVDDEWVETESKIPTIIYDRAFSKDIDQKILIEECRDFLKITNRVNLNPFELADLLNNKVRFHTFLQNQDIPTLQTFPFVVLEDEVFFEEVGSSKVYVKPTFGSKGEGIFVVEKKENGFALYDHSGRSEHFEMYTDLFVKLQMEIIDEAQYFVQEEAKTILFDDAPFDIRVLVQNYGNQYTVTGKAVRIGQRNAITSNLNSGGNALPMEELEHFFHECYKYSLEDLHQKIERLCLNCSEVLKEAIGEFCEIGFDILITKDRGPIILEANAKPSRWVFVKMADYFESIGKDNSYYLERRKETVSVPIKYATYLLK